jgi:hypothetical protein
LARGVGRWSDRAHEITNKRRVFSKGFRGRRDTDFEGGFVAGKEDFNSVTRLRAERKKRLDEWNFGPLAIVMAEIVKI